MDEGPVPAEQSPNQSQPAPAALTEPPAAFATVPQQRNGFALVGFVPSITMIDAIAFSA